MGAGEGRGKESGILRNVWNVNGLICGSSMMGDHKKTGSECLLFAASDSCAGKGTRRKGVNVGGDVTTSL